MGRAFEYRRAAKEKRWDKMSRTFPKLAKKITIAAKAGGPDPDLNSTLRTAILNAKAQNMPKTNIDAALNVPAEKMLPIYRGELRGKRTPWCTGFCGMRHR
jgi:transcriptional/translational regulatory protein YebC/TACO1